MQAILGLKDVKALGKISLALYDSTLQELGRWEVTLNRPKFIQNKKSVQVKS